MKLNKSELDEFWRIADKNADGRLTVHEIKDAIGRYTDTMKDATIAGIFCDIDEDQDGKITKNEFIKQMSKSRAQDLKKLWQQFDKDGNGHLSRKEVMDIIESYFSADKKDEVIGLFLQYSDLNGDRVVSKKEFNDFFDCD